MASSWIFSLAAAAMLLVPSYGAPFYPRADPSSPGQWIDTWTSMPQLVEPENLPPAPFNQSNVVFANSTLRQTLHMSLGADQIRVRLSNNFGVGELTVTAASVARPSNGSSGDPSINTSTLQMLTFSGNTSLTLPEGALGVSDPLNFTVAPQSTITVTLYLAAGQQSNDVTGHPGSRATSYFSLGNYVNSVNMTDSSTIALQHWYYLSAVEAWVPQTSSSFAILGDSITDGRGSDNDANNRWPDLVLARMQQNQSTSSIAVINQAAGGNRILNVGLGPAVMGRVERDILAHFGVKYAMIFEGVNDIGDAEPTAAAQQQIGDKLIEAYQQIKTRIHTFGIPLFAATITPFLAPSSVVSAYSDPLREQTRQRINNWIQTSGNFDYVLDFASIVADPNNSSMLNEDYNSGDYLHPNVAGYTAIANAFPLSIFQEFAGGVNTFA